MTSTSLLYTRTDSLESVYRNTEERASTELLSHHPGYDYYNEYRLGSNTKTRANIHEASAPIDPPPQNTPNTNTLDCNTNTPHKLDIKDLRKSLASSEDRTNKTSNSTRIPAPETALRSTSNVSQNSTQNQLASWLPDINRSSRKMTWLDFQNIENEMFRIMNRDSKLFGIIVRWLYDLRMEWFHGSNWLEDTNLVLLFQYSDARPILRIENYHPENKHFYQRNYTYDENSSAPLDVKNIGDALIRRCEQIQDTTDTLLKPTTSYASSVPTTNENKLMNTNNTYKPPTTIQKDCRTELRTKQEPSSRRANTKPSLSRHVLLIASTALALATMSGPSASSGL